MKKAIAFLLAVGLIIISSPIAFIYTLHETALISKDKVTEFITENIN